jgi:DNA-binding NarL/FixJ family response regulator
MIKVGIADDQSLMREGLKTILGNFEGIEVVATGQDGNEAVKICSSYDIDILLLDIRMPHMNGVEAVKEIKRVNKKVKIIMLTTFDDEEYIVEAIGNGASGYLFKDIEYDKLVENIREVHNGQYIMPSKVAQVLAHRILHAEERKDELKNYNFTARETEILEMLKSGFTNKQIGMGLCISDGTVKNYISSIYSKTGIEDRTELISFLRKVL